MKLPDLVSFHLVEFMYKFHNKLLPAAFDQFYIPAHWASSYSTRLAGKQSYYLPKTRILVMLSSIYHSKVLRYGIL